MSCRLGAVDITQLCIDNNAECDPLGSAGYNALQMAAAYGHVRCMDVILEVS